MSRGRLGDAVERVRRAAPPEGRAGQPGLGLDQIRPHALELTGWADAARLTGRAHRFAAGELLFGRLRPGFGKLVLADRAGICSPEAWVLRVRPGHCPAYVLHRLSAPDVLAAAVASATGARMPRARWERVADHPVCWPALDEQRDRVRPLEALRQERLADDAAARACLALARAAVDEHGVEEVVLGDVARLADRPADRDRAPSTPRVGVADLEPGRPQIETWGGADAARSRHVALRRGDLLFARIRPALRKVALAPVDGIVSPELLALEARDPALQGILAVVLLGTDLGERAAALATGTRMPRVHWRRLRTLRLPWPRRPSPALVRLCAAAAAELLARGAARRAALALHHSLRPRVLA